MAGRSRGPVGDHGSLQTAQPAHPTDEELLERPLKEAHPPLQLRIAYIDITGSFLVLLRVWVSFLILPDLIVQQGPVPSLETGRTPKEESDTQRKWIKLERRFAALS
ncbi:hypothetical protein NDU88_000354 [Pleurodeles waltl]|uniref:Uncharacterized protein n=1 Tax=Pleurodeles waltl TaxID=8319 RepID=A0AAV7TF81_PLEWA|nr:hypothetical protein NDU88_000354 [Pleurodeles waltl]